MLRTAGQWRILEALGEGGSATVYRAEHAQDHREGALKIPHPEGLTRLGTSWLRREASLAARLRHPHIVGLLESGQLEDGRPFLVFELVQGPTLDSVAEQLEARELVDLGSQILSALSYAHDAGVVHCDLSPNNVLIERRGTERLARLADFGLARTRDGSLADGSGPTLVAGTPGYFSPEQARGASNLGPRADLYAAGALLYRLLCGHPPHQGASTREILERTLSALPPGIRPRAGLRVPEALGEVCVRLLSRDPEARYPNAAQARRAWLEASEQPSTQRRTWKLRRPERDEIESSQTVLASGVGKAWTSGSLDEALHTAPTGVLREPAGRREGAGARERAQADLDAPAAIGREEALARLEGALPPAPPGPGGRRIAHLHGAPGAGKTHLLDHLARRAIRAGIRVCRATCRRGGASPPMEAIATLALDLVGAGGSDPPWILAERLGAGLEAAGIEEGDPGRDVLFSGLSGVTPAVLVGRAELDAFRTLEALRRHALGEGALLLLVDEADTLDASSRRVLSALLRAGGERVGAILASRARPRELESPPIELEALDEADSEALWAALDAPARPPSGGRLPGDLVLLAAALRAGDSDRRAADSDRREAGPGPEDELAWAAARLLEPLSGAELSLLRAAALYAGDAPRRGLSEVAEALGVQAGDAELQSLISRGLLGPIEHAGARLERWMRLRSEPIARAALEGIEPNARAKGERGVARWLSRSCFENSAGIHARIAAHAERVGELGKAAWACAEAGRMAADAHDLDQAQPQLERALALAERCDRPDAIDRAAVLARLAQLALDRGGAALAERYASAALAIIEPERQVLGARLWTLRASAATDRGEQAQALACVDAAIERLGEDGDPMELAQALATRGWVLGYVLGRNAEGIDEGRRALQVAARIDAPAFRASLCGRLGANYLRAGDWDGQLEANREDLALSARARDPFGLVRANINLGVCYTNRGALQRAREHTEEALGLATRHGALKAARIAHNNLAMIALDQGRGEEVEGHLAQVMELSERLGLRRGLSESFCTLARARLAEGRLVEAAEALERARAEAQGAIDEEVIGRIEARLRLLRGEAERALEGLEAIVSAPPSDPYERQASLLTLAMAFERSGREPEALALRERALRALGSLGADAALELRRWASSEV
ncbi:MAG: protein kinase [Myxococcales bacterium]|nr:protein kinase [Myxococcales bacterium]